MQSIHRHGLFSQVLLMLGVVGLPPPPTREQLDAEALAETERVKVDLEAAGLSAAEVVEAVGPERFAKVGRLLLALQKHRRSLGQEPTVGDLLRIAATLESAHLRMREGVRRSSEPYSGPVPTPSSEPHRGPVPTPSEATARPNAESLRDWMPECPEEVAQVTFTTGKQITGAMVGKTTWLPRDNVRLLLDEPGLSKRPERHNPYTGERELDGLREQVAREIATVGSSTMSPLKYEPTCGTDISRAAATLVSLAAEHSSGVAVADFNGIELRAEAGVTAEQIVAGYRAETERRYAAYIASPEYAARQVEAKVAAEKQERDVTAVLAEAPASMTLCDPEGWAKALAANQDSYGAYTLRYAERWARMMEAQMAKGQTLKECAVSTSLLADTEGITGSMHGFAVGILSLVWVHGADLRAAVR